MIKIKTKDAEIIFSDYDEAVKFYNENVVHEMTCEITTTSGGWVTADGNGNWVEDKKIQEEIDKRLLND